MCKKTSTINMYWKKYGVYILTNKNFDWLKYYWNECNTTLKEAKLAWFKVKQKKNEEMPM